MEKTSALRFMFKPAADPQAQRCTRNETPWDHNGLLFQMLEVNDHSLEYLTQASPRGKQTFLSPLSTTRKSRLFFEEPWLVCRSLGSASLPPSLISAARLLPSPVLLQQKPATQEFQKRFGIANACLFLTFSRPLLSASSWARRERQLSPLYLHLWNPASLSNNTFRDKQSFVLCRVFFMSAT